MDPHVLKTVNALRRNRHACAVVTNLADGRDRVVDTKSAQEVPGLLGQAIRRQLKAGSAATVEIDATQFFINPHIPPFRIVLVGAVHISQVLAPMAQMVGFDVEVVDPRSAFAVEDRFPNVPLSATWPDEAFQKNAIDEYCALVAVTHDPKIDDPALMAAINAGCRYVGALGSKKSHQARIIRLQELGLSAEEVSRIEAPVGLYIGAANPAEIAVAILASIILALRGPKGQKDLNKSV